MSCIPDGPFSRRSWTSSRWPEFHRCVERYRGNYKVQTFSCLDQFLSLAFAQLTYRESLRDIEACLGSMQPRLYHMGFRSEVARSTLAKANEQRDWRIYADVAQLLIREARQLYANEEMGAELDQTVYALDSTTIDLCLSLFPWAPHERSKAAVKMHTLLDVRGSIPSFVLITPGRVSDVRALDHLVLEAGSFYVMDRGYIHFARLYRFVLAAAFFVVRARVNMQYRRRYSHPVDKEHRVALRSDHRPHRSGFLPHLSRPRPANPLLRCRARSPPEPPHQQLRTARAHHRPVVQEPLERGVVLQMDQAAPAGEEVLRHFCQCRQDSTLGRADRLLAGGDSQEAAWPAGQPLQNSTNLEPHTF